MLQYFFIDKFAAQVGPFGQGLMLFNAVYMVVKSLLYVKAIIPLFSKKYKTIGFIGFGLLPLVMHFCRAYLTIEQVLFRAPAIKGACLEYDYKSAKVSVAPFNKNCLSTAEYVLLGSAATTLLVFLVKALYLEFSYSSKAIIMQERKRKDDVTDAPTTLARSGTTSRRPETAETGVQTGQFQKEASTMATVMTANASTQKKLIKPKQTNFMQQFRGCNKSQAVQAAPTIKSTSSQCNDKECSKTDIDPSTETLSRTRFNSI